MAKSYICVFDCETVPDTSLLRKIYAYTGDDISVCKQAFAAQKEATGSEFLPIMFHKVVAISAVMADEYGKFLRVSTMEGANEREILAKFLKFINERNPRLVSFNGRGFDLPMIMARSMRYNLSASAYYETENRELNKNKWENYRSRYDGRFHLDLLDHVSDFGAVRGLKLDTLCASLNLPGKYDVHGDEVMELYFNGKQAKINEYCESDTLNTYWLFLKFELLRGNITLEDYASHLNTMGEFLLNERADMGYTGVFCEMIDDELSRVVGESGYENFTPQNTEAEQNLGDETKNLDAEEEIYDEPISPNELEEHLAKSGLGGLLQKGGLNLKSDARKKEMELKAYESGDELPEIDLDKE